MIKCKKGNQKSTRRKHKRILYNLWVGKAFLTMPKNSEYKRLINSVMVRKKNFFSMHK